MAVTALVPLSLTAQIKFKKHQISTPSGYEGWVFDIETADLDNDGDYDIVSAGYGSDAPVAWFENDGAGNFTNRRVASRSAVGRPARTVYVIDLDEDGDKDILSASSSDDRIAWHENLGTSPLTWTSHTISTNADDAYGVFAADINGDGAIDVLSASTRDGKVAWYQNMGGAPPTWTEHAVVSNNSADRSVVAVDIDRDGDQDIISGNQDIVIFENDGTSPVPGFTQHSLMTGTSYLEGLNAYTGDPATWPRPPLDFNSDGRTDIISGYQWRKFGIWENGGFPSASFTRREVNLSNNHRDPYNVAVTDFDGDGDFDVVSSTYRTVAALHLNLGSNTFRSIAAGSEKVRGKAVAVADFNGDGQLDIVAGKEGGEWSEALVWYEGDEDSTPADAVLVTSPQTDGTYGPGSIIPIEVHFSEAPIEVTGTPQLTLDLNGTNKTINYKSVVDSILTFHYTVASGDKSSDLDIASTSALSLNSGSLKAFGNDVNLALPAPASANSLGGTKALVIDSQAPVVEEVSSTSADGIYGPGDVIPITVTFDDEVTPLGPVVLDANWTTNSWHQGGTLNWQSFTAENTGKLVKIDLDVKSPLGDRSATGTLKIFQGEGNSGTQLHTQPVTLRNATSTWTTYTLITPASVTEGDQYTWEVSTAEAPHSWLRYFNGNGYAGGRSSNSANGEYLFRTYVETGVPDIELTLETGKNDAVVDYTGGAGTKILTFNYTVAAGDSSTDLDYVATSSLVLKEGTVTDPGGNSATPFTLPAPGDAKSLAGMKDIRLDTEPPTLTFDPADGTDGVDLDKVVTLTFSDAVRKRDDTALDDANVDATVELRENDASGAVIAGIDATWDAASNKISIAHDDFASEQVVYAALKANAIEDAFNNPVAAANVTFTAADALAPTVTFSPADGVTGVSLTTSITITFNESVRNIDNSALDDDNVDARITLNEDDASGADLAFDATINTAKTVITIDPDNDFPGEQAVYACIDDKVEDNSDNAIAQTCVTFTSEDVAAPVVTFVPADGATGVAKDVVIAVNFTEPVRKTDDNPLDDNNVDALITLKENDNSGTNITFDASIKISRKKITVVPDSDFGSEEKIYVCVDPVEDASNNATSKECATFTTADISAAGITIDPADGATDVKVDKTITITSSEPLRQLDDSALDNDNIDRYILLKENSSSGTNIDFDATIEPGLALDFDGVDDYVDINAVADDMAGLTDWSISLWLKPEKASFPEDNAYIFAINCDNATTNCNKLLFGIDKATGNIFVYEDPSDSIVIQGSAASDGIWNQIVYSRSGSTGTLYLNGISQGTHAPAHVAFVASDKWSIGQEWDGTTVTNEFFGLMDEIAIWNEGLAANEVTALYNSGVALDAKNDAGDYTSSANLVGYWKMEDGTGTTLTDLSGNSNDGTLGGDPSWTTTYSIVSVDPTQNLGSEQQVYVDICCVEDEDGNLIATTSSTFTTEDANPPTVTFDPADGTADVAVDKAVTLTFNEAIRNSDDSAITNTNVDGLIVLKKDDANGDNISFDATINGTSTVITVNSDANFGSEQKVYVAIGESVVEDDTDNAVPRASATFTIADVDPPSITFFPVDGATGVPVKTVPTITFSEPVRNDDATELTDANVGGLITFKDTDDSGDDIPRTVTINAAKTVMTLTPTSDFASELDVYMCVDIVEDADGNPTVKTCATFKTSDVILPTVTWDPVNGSTGVAVNKTITLTFDEAVRNVNNSALDNDNVDGLITLRLDDADGDAISFDATVNAGNDVISVDPDNSLGSEVTVYVAIGATVEDDQNNAILATSSTFITADSDPPTVAFTPSDGSTNVAVDTVVTLTFSEPVRLLDGTAMDSSNIAPLITLEEVQSVQTASGRRGRSKGRNRSRSVSFSSWAPSRIDFSAKVNDDKTVVTVVPSKDLASEQLYTVSIGATVEDAGDNPLAASSASFTTADQQPPTVTFNPADGDTGVSVTTDIVITFDEAVRYLDDSVISSSDVADLLTLKETDSSGTAIGFTASINDHQTEITIKPAAPFITRQTIYAAISAGVEDDVNNAILPASSTFKVEETPQIVVSTPSSSFTTEEGGTTTFTLTLGKEPTDDVVVAVMSQDETEGKTDVSALTFPKQLWDEPLQVEVTGQDDEIDDGNVSYVIALTGVVSQDTRYNGLDPDDVPLINRDDLDAAGITVKPRRGLETTEAAAKDSFSIQLESEPIAPVTIPLASTKPAEGELSADSLRFTAADWSTPQTVTVTGLNDLVVDGDRTYKILTRLPVTEDSIYAAINAKDIVVTNRAREPIMVVTADSLKYGRVERDGFNVQSFDVVNVGTDTLRVNNGELTSRAFIVDAPEFDVPPRDTGTVFIQFIPEEAITYSAQFKAKHNDTSKGDIEIELIGEAFKPTVATADTVVDFGEVFVFFDEDRELPVFNDGNEDLRIDSMLVSGKYFSIPKMAGIYLKPRDTTLVPITYSSLDSGIVQGNLRIFSNDQDRPRLDIPIRATVLPPDTLGPEFQDIIITPGDVLLRQFVDVKTELKDKNDVEEAILYFLEGGQTEFTAYPMMTEDGLNYQFISGPADVTMRGIAFYLEAKDERGNIAVSDTLSPPVNFRDGSLRTTLRHSAYPDGIPEKLWRLISVPAGLDKPDVVTTFEDNLSGEPNSTKWRIFEAGSSEGHANWRQPEEIETGHGYWLIQAVDDLAELSTGAGETIPLTGFDFTLQPGWNLIGSPYAFPIRPQFVSDAFYGPLSYGGTSDGWNATDTLNPWGGYIVYSRAASPVTVTVDPLDSKQEGEPVRRLKRKYEVGEWNLRLAVSGRKFSDSDNFIGRTVGAEEGVDKFDNPEPPYPEKYLSLVFESELVSGQPVTVTSDIRSVHVRNGVWDGQIRVKGEKGPITFSADLTGSFPKDDVILLLDMTTREQYYLLEEGVFEIAKYSEEFPYRFKVFSGSPAFVAAALAEALALLPEKFALRQNYPNPFNPSTTIEFTLPQPAEVSLVIYNLMGQEVRTLKRGMMDTGHHSLRWHGKNNRGELVGSGVYFVRFMSAKFSASHKMVLMK